MSWHHDIRPAKRDVCFDVSQSIHKAPVILYSCHGMKGNQHFKYNPVSVLMSFSKLSRDVTRSFLSQQTSQLYHPISNQCLDSDSQQREIFMRRCDEQVASQKWKWQHLNATLVQQDWNSKDR